MRLGFHFRNPSLDFAEGGGEDRGGGDGGRDSNVDVAHPFVVDLGPFLDGVPVGFRRCAVVLAGAGEVLGVGEARGFPVGAELFADGGCDWSGGKVGGGGDGEVRVAEGVAPVVGGWGGVEGVGGNLGGGYEGTLCDA